MGKKIWFLLLNLILNTSCQSQTNATNMSFSNEDRKICDIVISYWNQLFAHPEQEYLNYIYSDTCYHCLSIKEEIEEFACSCSVAFYFIPFEEDIPIGIDIEATIGATSVEECFIKGTPTLILIENWMVSFNIAGTENILQTIILYKD